MANYKTHRNIGLISVGVATAGIVSFAPMISDFFHTELYFSPLSISLAIFFGVVGSIFPDIDLKTSRPAKFMRYFLALFLTFAFAFFINDFISENLINLVSQNFIAPITWFSDIVFAFFSILVLEKSMVHRGLVHSIPFGVFSSLVLYNIVYNMPETLTLSATLIATTFFIGFITHLVLDELYSVDFLGARIKKSFGTALKLCDCNNAIGTLTLYGMIGFISLQTFFTFL